MKSQLLSANLTFGHWGDDGNLTVLVAMEDSVYARPVSPPDALDESVLRGPAAEAAALRAASVWGLPDFLFDPTVVRKGSGTREVGDGLLLVGESGLILQSKARLESSGNVDREVSWIEKNARAAYAQARGTLREQLSGPVELTNRRGRLLQFDGSSVRWVALVIVDHDSPPEVPVDVDVVEQLRCVVVTRRDWHFLFDQLRSTVAVVDYVHRVGSDEPLPLGHEPLRYFEFARADANMPLGSPPEWVNVPSAVHRSWPRLPSAPPDATDPVGHSLLRVILDDIAESTMQGKELERLRVLAAIDRAPLAYRAEVGRKLLGWLEDASAGEKHEWRAIRMLDTDLHLLLSVFPLLTPFHQDLFYRASAVRHSDYLATAPESIRVSRVTVAVLLTPRFDGRRAWDTTVYAFEGDLNLSQSELDEYRSFWGPDA